MTQTAEPRSFSVRARHLNPHDARVVREVTFEAAAVAYAEDLHVAPDDGDAISLIVRDVETGHEHCFRIELETGETSPCG